MIKLRPIEPDRSRTPFGETNMPLPKRKEWIIISVMMIKIT